MSELFPEASVSSLTATMVLPDDELDEKTAVLEAERAEMMAKAKEGYVHREDGDLTQMAVDTRTGGTYVTPVQYSTITRTLVENEIATAREFLDVKKVTPESEEALARRLAQYAADRDAVLGESGTTLASLDHP